MKFNELKYSRRVNLGDYSSEEISLSVVLDEGESPSVIFPKLKAFVMNNIEKKKPEAVAPAPVTTQQVAIPVAQPVAAAIQAKPLAAQTQSLRDQILESSKKAGVSTSW
jgi:hypothetical protein